MKKIYGFILAAAIILLSSSNAFSYNSLRVYNPKNMNQYTNGNIDTMIVSVTPQGLYAEIGVYIAFSPQPNTYFKFPDSLEVEYKFSLPANASMIDSWLWFDGYIIKAKHYDRWTGNQIYENIVKRTRKDPSILYKNSATDYEMRVFPIQPQSYRKVKMTYLIPMNIDSRAASVNIPFDLASASYTKSVHKEIIVYTNDEFKNPRLQSNGSQEAFIDQNDEFYGEYKRAVLGTKTLNIETLEFDSPMKNGIFLYADIIHKNYQTAFDVSVDQYRQPRKLMLVYSNSSGLLEYNYYTNNYTSHLIVINQLKEFLKRNLNERDSFNIIFPGLYLTPISQTWIPCTTEQIESHISNIDTSKFDIYENLPLITINALDWVQKNSDKADIVLLTKNADYFENNVMYGSTDALIIKSNSLITELKQLNTHANPLHIIDLNPFIYDGFVVNGIEYYNNQYLHNNLVNLFNGSLVELYNKPWNSSGLSSAFDELSNNIFSGNGLIDLNIDVENGFTYSNYTLSGSDDRVIKKIGKFVGDTLFSYRLISVIDGIATSKTKSLSTNENGYNDYKTRQIIAGLEIIDYEKTSNPSAQIVHSIINTALSNRVLSKYTTFLALEYGDTLNTTINSDIIGEENGTTSVSDGEEIEFATISASPSPFSASTNIKCKFNESETLSNVDIYVSDVLGNKVRTLTTFSLPMGNEFSIDWDGRTDSGELLPSGVYFITLTMNDKHITIKVIKI